MFCYPNIIMLIKHEKMMSHSNMITSYLIAAKLMNQENWKVSDWSVLSGDRKQSYFRKPATSNTVAVLTQMFYSCFVFLLKYDPKDPEEFTEAVAQDPRIWTERAPSSSAVSV